MGDVAAFITSGPPLMITVEGATVECPAFILDNAPYVVGRKVTVTVRNPTPPLIKGEET